MKPKSKNSRGNAKNNQAFDVIKKPKKKTISPYDFTELSKALSIVLDREKKKRRTKKKNNKKKRGMRLSVTWGHKQKLPVIAEQEK